VASAGDRIQSPAAASATNATNKEHAFPLISDEGHAGSGFMVQLSSAFEHFWLVLVDSVASLCRCLSKEERSRRPGRGDLGAGNSPCKL